MTSRKIIVNGQEREVQSPANTPLLWVLRDELQLTGTKFGCGIAACGACTVQVDGMAVRACVFPLSAVQGEVRTIEGLGTEESPHPLQRAWMEHSVPQCGYCQSGQLMSAAALLERNPTPTRADVDTAMSGNLCRCGTYPRIRRAILSVVPTTPPTAPPTTPSVELPAQDEGDKP
jgi:isoquinoline 1-oxidoreductase alpha subunit